MSRRLIPVARSGAGGAPASLVAVWLSAELAADPPARVTVHDADLVVVSGPDVAQRLPGVLGDGRFVGWSMDES